eukprot:767968-Hanusia_phi.AAC.8
MEDICILVRATSATSLDIPGHSRSLVMNPLACPSSSSLDSVASITISRSSSLPFPKGNGSSAPILPHPRSSPPGSGPGTQSDMIPGPGPGRLAGQGLKVTAAASSLQPSARLSTRQSRLEAPEGTCGRRVRPTRPLAGPALLTRKEERSPPRTLEGRRLTPPAATAAALGEAETN